jgi:hypothetical protein
MKRSSSSLSSIARVSVMRSMRRSLAGLVVTVADRSRGD